MKALLLSFCLLGSLSEAEIYHGVAVAPDGMNAWVVTIETTVVYHTTDFGMSWQPQEVLTIRDFFDVFFLDELHGWTCGRIGDIWHTTDGGENWSRQNLGGPKFATRIRFLNDSFGWCAGGEAILLNTTNGGEEWDMTFFPNPPYPMDTVDFQGVFYVSPDTGWLVAGRFPSGDTFVRGQGYITRTTNGGDTWVLQKKDTICDFYDVAFIDNQTGWVVGGDDQTMNAVVLHTANSGQDWNSVTVPAEARFLRSVKFIGDRHGWACGRNGTIIHSSDAGLSWELQTTNVDTTLFDIDFADTLRGMVAGNSVVLFTTNGGQSWVRGLGAVHEPSGTVGPELSGLRVFQNPDGSRVWFQVAGVNGKFELALYDALGRTVRVFCEETRGRTCRVVWDGTGLAGRPAAPGIYLAQLKTGGRSETARFVYLPAAR